MSINQKNFWIIEYFLQDYVLGILQASSTFYKFP